MIIDRKITSCVAHILSPPPQFLDKPRILTETERVLFDYQGFLRVNDIVPSGDIDNIRVIINELLHKKGGNMVC